MRNKLIIATTAGVLSLSGLAVAVPALADTDGPAASAVERITEALSGLVEDGSITEEQADEVAATLAEAGLGRHGGHHGARLGLEAAADALDMTEEELRTALEPEGTTLADVAEDQGVALDTLVAALVEAAEERLADAVESGRLTEEQADERRADLEERITERITTARPDRPTGGGHGGPHGD